MAVDAYASITRVA